MPKILHSADLHLDAPFSLLDVQKAQTRKNELRGTFASLILLAKTEKADIVILAGDLFDSGFVTKETTSLMISQFASVPECRFVITPGNHDFVSPRSPYKKEAFPDNVYIFCEEEVKALSFDDLGVVIYGFGYVSETYKQNPLAAPFSLDRTRINIFAGHCDLAKESGDAPITANDIARSGFDYVALGHIHKGGEIMYAGETIYAYSGCPEGRSFDECGVKGVILADLQKENGRLTTDITTRRICRRRYEKLSVNVTGVSNSEELFEKVRAAVVEAKYGSDVLLRVKLKGQVPTGFVLKKEALTAQNLGVFYLEVKDDTVPLLDAETLKNDISIRGAFFRELMPLLESEDEKQRETAAQALRLGLAALDGCDVVDF